MFTAHQATASHHASPSLVPAHKVGSAWHWPRLRCALSVSVKRCSGGRHPSRRPIGALRAIVARAPWRASPLWPSRWLHALTRLACAGVSPPHQVRRHAQAAAPLCQPLRLPRKGGLALRPPSPRGVAPSLLAQPPAPTAPVCSHAAAKRACRFAVGAARPSCARYATAGVCVLAVGALKAGSHPRQSGRRAQPRTAFLKVRAAA